MAKLIREVKVRDVILYSVVAPLILLAIWLLTPLVLVRCIPLPPWTIYVAAALITYYPLKRAAIGAVLLYKIWAPLSTRGRCRFYPTCSTYMIMAIWKFGLFFGVYKGIRRITRCRPPNGGIDYP